MGDSRLVRAIRRGDTAAFERLYRRHKDAVLRFACALGARLEDGEDLVQDAFMGLLRNIDHIDERRAVLPYLLRSVRNRHFDRLRSFAARGQPLRVPEPTATAESPDEGLERSERASLLETAFAELSEPQREVVRLHVFGGMSYQAIAEEQATPAATVRTRYRAALEKLRRFLGRSVGDE